MTFRIPLGTSKKHHRADDEDTYAFTIDVVKARGSDSHQTADVLPVLALFNASSLHSWISWKFAESLGIEKSAKSVKLTWKCATIGRNIQRTVFMVAPYAGFDLLFAEQMDQKSFFSDTNRFELGIQPKLIMKLVKNENMLLVRPAPPDPNNALTLAQLSARLSRDSQRYHDLSNDNVERVQANLGGLRRASSSWKVSKERGHIRRRILRIGKVNPHEIIDMPLLQKPDEEQRPTKRAKTKQSPNSSFSAGIVSMATDENRLPCASHSTGSFTTQRLQSGTNALELDTMTLPRFHKICPSEDVSDDSIASDLLDQSYWILDETSQRYYHLEKETNEKWWYEAPP